MVFHSDAIEALRAEVQPLSRLCDYIWTCFRGPGRTPVESLSNRSTFRSDWIRPAFLARLSGAAHDSKARWSYCRGFRRVMNDAGATSNLSSKKTPIQSRTIRHCP